MFCFNSLKTEFPTESSTFLPIRVTRPGFRYFCQVLELWWVRPRTPSDQRAHHKAHTRAPIPPTNE